MYSLWVVSEDASLPATLAFHLRSLGEVWTGPPDAGHFKDADVPDLLVVAAAPAGDDRAALERLLGFLRGVPHPRRAPAPVLYIEPPQGSVPTPLIRSLVDDRRLTVLPWPLDPVRLASDAATLLHGPETPPSLRERARREWVSGRVERLYAGLDLPALRHAIDPRNAARPVLLVGEPGTRRGLLARYIHNLAEPALEEFLPLPVWGLGLSQVESMVLGRCAGRRATVFLQDLERADPVVQEELAQLLTESGAVGIEPIRWIASALRPDVLAPSLRSWTWLRVDLPPLRARPDLAELARALAAAWGEANQRAVALSPEALEAISRYAWPGNLRELESVLDASLSAAPEAELRAVDLRFAADLAPPPDLESPVRPAAPAPTPPEVRRAPEAEPAREPAAAAPASEAPPLSDERASGPPAFSKEVREIVAPLAEEIRGPLRAIRTYASLLDQRPDDESVRRELSGIIEGDLSQVERTLQRLELFASFGAPRLEPVDLPALVAAELEQRQAEIRERSLVVLRELDHQAPRAVADESQVRFAVGALLDRALRMVPSGGDLYVGSFHREGQGDAPSGHRLLIRFHSPEDVLVSPADLPGPGAPVEVVLARELIERMGGAFAIDTSGSQDNVVLIELLA